MAPLSQAEAGANGLERVRARILTALHVGRLRPGDRVPSVRRLAGLTGLNHKTIHRAYAALAEEGLLEVRPGSGTFVRERRPGTASPEPGANALLSALNRSRAEAMGLGLRPEAFARFLEVALGDGLRGLPIAVAECNGEQRGMIGRELAASLGLAPREVSIEDLESDPRRSLHGVWAVVTTDCHLVEVAAAAEPLGMPVYAVALDAEFPGHVTHWAGQGPVVLVVRDEAFAPVFRRLLVQMRVPRERIERLAIVEPRGIPAALRAFGDDAAVSVSPLVRDEAETRLPPSTRRIAGWWSLHPGAVDRLRASLALDAALRHRFA